MRLPQTIDPFRNGNTQKEVVRRFFLWAVIASVSAVPSFMWGQEFHRRAMVLGVFLFVLLLTAITCTERFDRIKRRDFIRRTLYIGYGVRLALSVVFPIGAAIDMMPGMVSLSIAGSMIGEKHEFLFTLVATLIQGTLLNTIIFLFMLIVYGIQRYFCRRPNAHACPKCAYDLRGTPEGACCPECGDAVPVAEAIAA